MRRPPMRQSRWRDPVLPSAPKRDQRPPQRKQAGTAGRAQAPGRRPCSTARLPVVKRCLGLDPEAPAGPPGRSAGRASGTPP